jgi:hypothetical protein
MSTILNEVLSANQQYSASEPKQSVVDDVLRIRAHPLVPSSIPIYGHLYDVKSAKLIEVEEVTKVGATG